MKKYDYVLVGSGLYSGVFAWFAKQKGKKCLVLEKRDHIGGDRKSTRLNSSHSL